MRAEETTAKERFSELNRSCLEESDRGKCWDDVKPLMDEMVEIAKRPDGAPRNGSEVCQPSPEKNRNLRSRKTGA